MSATNAICLEGVVDISKAESVYSDLEALLSGGGDIRINAENVDRIDTSVMQLIVSLKQALAEHGAQLLWESPSTAVVNTARLLGVQEVLGLQ